MRLAGRWLLALALAGWAPAAGQSLSRFERGRGLQMVDVIERDVRQHYFDSTFGGVDLADHRLELEIDPSRPVAAGDTLYVVGASHALERAATRLLGKSISLMKRDVVPAEADTSGAAG